jgi:hypothetical protein
MGYEWIAYVVAAIIIILAYLLMPKPRNNFDQAIPPSKSDVTVPTVSESKMIPIVFGTVWLNEPNVVWYGDIIITEIKETMCS